MSTSLNSNFDDYTLEELVGLKKRIDQEKYPELYNEICIKIQEIYKLENPDYKCIRCGSEDYELGEIYVTGRSIGELFAQQTKFKTITCCRCNYTELYKCSKERSRNILDFLNFLIGR